MKFPKPKSINQELTGEVISLIEELGEVSNIKDFPLELLKEEVQEIYFKIILINEKEYKDNLICKLINKANDNSELFIHLKTVIDSANYHFWEREEDSSKNNESKIPS